MFGPGCDTSETAVLARSREVDLERLTSRFETWRADVKRDANEPAVYSANSRAK